MESLDSGKQLGSKPHRGGNLHNGFAWVRCHDCGHESLLAFSCKRRHFCPACHQRRVVEFGEWLCEEVLLQ
ncbi:MAG: transposase zinc-binding domain-containing protein [Desulfosudaceae bacterium]